MGKAILSLIALLFIASVSGTWRTTELHRSDRALIEHYSMFIDPVTKSQHTIFYDRRSLIFIYQRVSSSGTITAEKNFTVDTLTLAGDGAIRGSQDGRNLYVIIHGTYDHGITVSDIWYTESTDGGDSWTKPVALPRYVNAEYYSREAAALLAIDSAKRVFIFYAVDIGTGQFDRSRYFRFVTKPMGSAVFSAEYKLFEGGPVDVCKGYLLADYTLNAGKPIIHLIWGESSSLTCQGYRPSHPSSDTEGIRHMYSINNGISWSEPKTIADDFAYTHKAELTVNRKLAPSTMALLFTFSNNDHIKRLVVFRDHGKKLDTLDLGGPDQKEKNQFMHTTGIAICGRSDKPILYSLIDRLNQVPKYSVVDLNTMKEKEISPRPFESHGDDILGINLACNQDGSKTVVSAITQVGYAQPLMFLLMDTTVYSDN